MGNPEWEILEILIKQIGGFINELGSFLPDFRELSFLLIVFAAAFLYFGRIVGDTRVEKYDKAGYYLAGFYFTIIYVFLSLAVTIKLYPYFGSKLNLPLVFAIHVLILSFLLVNFRAHHILRQHGFIEVFKKELERKISEMKRKKTTLGKLMEKYEPKLGISYVEFIMKIFYEYPIKVFSNQYVLLFLSILVFSALLKVIQTEIDLLVLTGIFILTLSNLTMMAFAYGYGSAYYPPAKLILDDETVICGKILKFGEFIYLIDGDRKIFVNSSKVKVIEESLFKDVDPCKGKK